MKVIPVYTIDLPEYRAEPDTDWLAVGRKLDRLIETHFADQRLAVRAIGLVDHPQRSIDDLVTTVLELGTDRYDPDREGLYYEHPGTDTLYAGPYAVTPDGLRSLRAQHEGLASAMAWLVEIFYDGALADRGYPVRLDLLLLYALDRLEPLGDQQPEESCYFGFRDPGRKRDALLGLIRIAR